MKASAFAFAGAVLTYFGFMHGEAVGIGGGFGVTPGVALAYAVVAIGVPRGREVRHQHRQTFRSTIMPLAAPAE